MTSVNAELFHREQEPDFYARKCRRCKQPERKCECEDNLDRDYGGAFDGNAVTSDADPGL